MTKWWKVLEAKKEEDLVNSSLKGWNKKKRKNHNPFGSRKMKEKIY